MGIVDKIISTTVTTVATKSILKTAGQVAVSTTGGILEKTSQNGQQQQNNPNAKCNYIKVKGIEQFLGQHYLKARAAFISMGFYDITVFPKKDLTKGWFSKDGEVAEISIGGRSVIKKNEKFLCNTPIIIFYHTFKEGLSTPEQSNVDNDIKLLPQMNQVEEVCIFCVNCGTRHSKSDNFCSKCGNRLIR